MNSKKILITGVSGFVGSHLLDKIIEGKKEEALFGTYFSDRSIDNLGSNKGKIDLKKLDLRDEEAVTKLVSDIKPDYIYHLAAFTSAADSFSSPNMTVVNNISSQINLLESLKKNNLKQTKMLITSSAEVYGSVKKEELPIDEDTPFNPTNPYAVSKLSQDFLGKQYFTAYGLQIIRARPFNHIGPRQSPDFVVSSFAKKIAEIEKGKMEPVLNVGNLEAKRDFTDVRDVVGAYILLMEKGEVGDVYNIGSGVSYKISDILDKLLSMSSIKVDVRSDKSLFRPIDDPELLCDSSKIEAAVGWEAKIPLEKSLKDTLDYWRNII